MARCPQENSGESAGAVRTNPRKIPLQGCFSGLFSPVFAKIVVATSRSRSGASVLHAPKPARRTRRAPDGNPPLVPLNFHLSSSLQPQGTNELNHQLGFGSANASRSVEKVVSPKIGPAPTFQWAKHPGPISFRYWPPPKRSAWSRSWSRGVRAGLRWYRLAGRARYDVAKIVRRHGVAFQEPDTRRCFVCCRSGCFDYPSRFVFFFRRS